MIKLLQKLFLFGVLIASSSTLWCVEKQSGGQGHIDSSITNACFKPNSETVQEVCARYRINWKMWSLMGEPVGDYNLAWDLTSIQLMDPKRKLISNYSLDQLPDELKKAASKIELYIDGFANAQASANIGAIHRFNTGTAVRASVGSSINVPGSPNWNRLFIKPGGSPCSTEQSDESRYFDSKKAKEIFTEGIKLNDLHICQSSSVSELTSLESAISTLCEKPGADKKYQFCPKQKAKEEETKKPPQEYTSNIWDELDDKGAEPEIRKRLKELRDAYRSKATHLCDAELKKINTCYTTSNCQPKSENETQVCYEKTCGVKPSEKTCVTECWTPPRDTSKDREGVGYLVFPECGSTCKSNPEYEPWQSCTQNASKCRVDQSCIDKCNPHNYSNVDQCVEKSMQNGPTTEDAKKLVREGWKKKASQPKPSPSQPTNFLD